MKRRLFLAIFALVGISALSDAQDARTLIEQDPGRIGNQLHRYEVPEIRDTRAPRGFKPFYVSHYGRHGSRYQVSETVFDAAIGTLGTLDSLGLLTVTGRSVLADLDTLRSFHRGMAGFLTQVGSREHQGVAERLYARCPEVFRQKGRNEVLAVSSTVVRCNQSMMNFCTALKGKAPSLDIAYYANRRVESAVTRVASGKPVSGWPDNAGEVLDSIKQSRMDISRIAPVLFTDPVRAAEYARGGNLKNLIYNIIYLGVIGQCLDEDAPDINRYFTTDELFNYWVAFNASTLNAHGICYENRGIFRRCGRMEVIDIISKADGALADGSRKAADFRFGHDGGVLPLVFFLGLERNDAVWHLGTEWEHGWYGFENIPMCANVQFIFYRNRKGEVLVKILHNERETTITRLKPLCGPYYRWEDLRPYLESLTRIDC